MGKDESLDNASSNAGLSARNIPTKPVGLHFDIKEQRGLILQVTGNGARSWILRTTIQGKRRDMGLGGWPETSLKDARDKALKFRKIARDGGDPFIERDKSKLPIPTFEEAAKSVHKEHSASWENKKHREQVINTLTEYAFPTLGTMRVDAIKSGDIMRALGPVWLEKPETARRVLQRIGTVLLWAKGKGFRTDSPTEEIAAARGALPKQTDKPKHHDALPYSEVPSFIVKLRAFKGTSEQIKLGLEFLILTATRTSEVLRAQWPEVNLDKGLWTIPASRMKAKREHVVPLSPRCIEILEQARKLSDGKGYIFPGTVTGKALTNMVFLMLLRRMSLVITAHGFRSSFRVWAAEKSLFPREVAEAALAHVLKDATEASYMRSTFLTESDDNASKPDKPGKRWRMMDDWTGYATQRSAEIIKIGKRA